MNIVVVWFGFEPSNLRKQPWRYVHELITELPNKGSKLTVVTDVDRTKTAGIRVKPVKKLLDLTGPTREVITAIRQESPDLVISLVGSSSFMRRTTIASVIDKPTIGIVGGPLYSPTEVFNIGVTDIYKYRQYLSAHLIGSLVPEWLIRKHASAYDCLITLTTENESRLRDIDVNSRVSTIPPGITDFDLDLPDGRKINKVRQDLNPEGVPMILYFTSPLTIRGTDTLIKSFARVRQEYPCKLVILSRQDSGGLTEEENFLRELAVKHSVDECFEIIPRNLSPEGIRTHLAAADIIALPFKIVVASVPISILESMSVGRPVITTDIAGIPEIGDKRQLVKPSDVPSLSAALESFVTDEELRKTTGSRNREQMQSYQRWDDARAQLKTIIEGYA